MSGIFLNRFIKFLRGKIDSKWQSFLKFLNQLINFILNSHFILKCVLLMLSSSDE